MSKKHFKRNVCLLTLGASLLTASFLLITNTIINNSNFNNQEIRAINNNNEEISFTFKTKLIDNNITTPNINLLKPDSANFRNNNIFEVDENSWIVIPLSKIMPNGLESSVFLENTRIYFNDLVVNNNLIEPKTLISVKNISNKQQNILSEKPIGEKPYQYTFFNGDELVGLHLNYETKFIEEKLPNGKTTQTLKIRPFISKANFNEAFSFPEQDITISLSSPYFEVDEYNKVFVNHFQAYEGKMNIFSGSENKITIGSTTTTSKEWSPGQKPILFDTKDFYFDELMDSSTKDYIVEIDGIKISDLLLNGKSYIPQDVYSDFNFNFKINEDHFIKSDGSISPKLYYKVNLFNLNQEIVGETTIPDPNTASTSDQANIYFEINRNGVQEYSLSKIHFHALPKVGSQISELQYTISSSNLKMNIKPSDYDLMNINYEIDKLKFKEEQLISQYSPDVFDNSEITGYKSNYDLVFESITTKLNTLFANNHDFKTSGLNFNNLNSPFIKSNYSSNATDDYKSSGHMTVSYAPKKEYKMMTYFEILQRNKMILAPNKSQYIPISLNEELIKKMALNYPNIDLMLSDMNNGRDKHRFLNIDTSTTAAIPQAIVKNIVFSKVENSSNKIDVKFDLADQFLHLKGTELVSKGSFTTDTLIFSEIIHQIVNISLNNDFIANEALKYNDYNEFQKAFTTLEQKMNLIQGGNFNQIESIEFVSQEGFTNRIFLEITLKNHWVFPDTSKISIFSSQDINWKGQNNIPKEIFVKEKVDHFATLFSLFESQDDFLKQNPNPVLKDYESYFEYKDSSIEDIHSISFSKGTNNNEMNITLLAKEWRYFSNPENDKGMTTKIITISNIGWNNQDVNSKGVSFTLDEVQLFNKIKDYDSMELFINENKDTIFSLNNASTSIVKMEPFFDDAVFLVNIFADKNNSLNINIKVNNGYYVDLEETPNQDKHNSTFNITLDEQYFKDLKDKVEGIYKNNYVDVSIKHQLMLREAKTVNDMNTFIRMNNDEFSLISYLDARNNLNDEVQDYNWLDKISLVKVNDNVLNVVIDLNNKYYFKDESFSIKQKIIPVQLSFKGDQQTFEVFAHKIKRETFANKIRSFNSYEDFSNEYNSTEKLKEFFQFGSGNENEAIKSITTKEGSTKRIVIFVIELNQGYYFKNMDESQLVFEEVIHNLIWANEDITFPVVKYQINGNLVMEEVKKYKNFEDFYSVYETKEKLLEFFEIDTASLNGIKDIELFNSSKKNRIYFRVILNNEYQFENENYTLIQKDILLGNIFYLNDEVPQLVENNITMNIFNLYDQFWKYEKYFKKIAKLKDIKTLEQIINETKNQFLNFKDWNDSILNSNVKNINNYEIVDIYVNEVNEIIIKIQMKNGFYFDENDKTKVMQEFTIKTDDLNDFYMNAKNRLKDYKKNKDLITIGVSVSVGVVVLTSLIIWFLVAKKKRRQLREGEI